MVWWTPFDQQKSGSKEPPVDKERSSRLESASNHGLDFEGAELAVLWRDLLLDQVGKFLELANRFCAF